MKKILTVDSKPSLLERAARKIEETTQLELPKHSRAISRLKPLREIQPHVSIKDIKDRHKPVGTVKMPDGELMVYHGDGSLHHVGRTFPKGHRGKVLRKKFRKMRATHS